MSRSLSGGTSNPCFGQLVFRTYVCTICAIRQLPSLLSAGVSPKIVSEQLGHASVAFTLEVYSHVLPHMQDTAAMKVEALLMAA
jgi:integrase